MTDIVERLRFRADENYEMLGNIHEPLLEAANTITRLRAENSSLSAWQCVYTDGKTGMVGDEHGNQYCAMAKMVEALRAEVERLTALTVKADEAIARQQQDLEKAADQAADCDILRAEIERLRSALIPFACRCARKGEGAGGTCLAPGGICSSWNARAALEEKPND